MRVVVGEKPIQNPYGHGKRPYVSPKQGTQSCDKKSPGTVAAQRIPALKQNRRQQEKIIWEELVRTERRAHAEIVPSITGKNLLHKPGFFL